MTKYTAEPILAGLKGFQRATVDHVTGAFYDRGANRFLVADETGLGKSVVARGVIARAVERLQYNDAVQRIDVVYICSNVDIANQNLARLDIGEGEVTTLASRLTLMAKHSRQLATARAGAGKPLNLVAFTPGTSFDKGWRTGKAQERAMLYLILEQALELSGWPARSALRALQGTTSTIERFRAEVERLREQLDARPDETIAAEFVRTARAEGLLDTFCDLMDDIGRRRDLTRELHERCRSITGGLRATLAKASVATLEPDLIILDEFQRFRHLLSVEDGGEAAELAQHMFNYPQAKVLLLSATPYKPYTLSEESGVGEDHHKDFLKLLWFLRAEPAWHREVREQLAHYRDAAIAGRATGESARAVRRLLLAVMCRTERPVLGDGDMLREHSSTVSPVPGDLLGYRALRSLAAELNGAATIEYWKSAPYFVNFMEDYQLGGALRKALHDPSTAERIAPLIAHTQRIDAADVRRFRPVDFGNARLRELAAQTVGQQHARLLWVPPSMPYYGLRGPFADARAEGMTKRLVFSSWTATPTAVAALLSYEAERQVLAPALVENTAQARRRLGTRLEYRLEQGRPAAMSTLALFWPHPGLAGTCDPLTMARERPGMVADPDELAARVTSALRRKAPSGLVARDHIGGVVPWRAYLQWPRALPAELIADHERVRDGLSGQGGELDTDGSRGLTGYVARAMDVLASPEPAASSLDQLLPDMVALGMHGPGNVAWRALGRLLGGPHRVTRAGHWAAAAVLSSGLRALFNRPESAALLGDLWPDEPYWRAVLRYSADGCLQATMDEYLHHLHHNQASATVLDDAALLGIARAASQAMSLRSSVYQAVDPENVASRIGFTSRFALRYGARSRDQDTARPAEVRNAFNSPFWPFVLTTTSAGQEGIDFHWWSHAVVHWDIPANPVDFEQREGRVHRFGGHVIRRNVAARHREAILSSVGSDPWDDAYRIAADDADGLGEFAPYWVYPGHSHVQRHLLPYPLSRDVERIARLRDSLALYRLAFGQPRQEDMVELLQRRGHVTAGQSAIDLRPYPLTGGAAGDG